MSLLAQSVTLLRSAAHMKPIIWATKRKFLSFPFFQMRIFYASTDGWSINKILLFLHPWGNFSVRFLKFFCRTLHPYLFKTPLIPLLKPIIFRNPSQHALFLALFFSRIFSRGLLSKGNFPAQSIIFQNYVIFTKPAFFIFTSKFTEKVLHFFIRYFLHLFFHTHIWGPLSNDY